MASASASSAAFSPDSITRGSLIDAGTTADGVTYVVLEFVDGQPVTAWCQAQALSLAARVELA